MRGPNSCLLISAAAILVWATGCKSESKNVEKLIPVAPPKAMVTPEAAVKLSPATPAEVEAKVHAVFGDNVIVVVNPKHPSFITGDFNGDDSEDLAVVVRPAPGKLGEINGELANWIIQDADKFFVARPGQHVVSVPAIAEAKVAEREQVLAIINGHGAKGWHSPDALQAYLVKHAAGTFLGTTRSVTKKSLRVMHLPFETDIILEARKNQKGFLFWTGGQYGWHPE